MSLGHGAGNALPLLDAEGKCCNSRYVDRCVAQAWAGQPEAASKIMFESDGTSSGHL
jgi:hypothetical protein